MKLIWEVSRKKHAVPSVSLHDYYCWDWEAAKVRFSVVTLNDINDPMKKKRTVETTKKDVPLVKIQRCWFLSFQQLEWRFYYILCTTNSFIICPSKKLMCYGIVSILLSIRELFLVPPLTTYPLKIIMKLHTFTPHHQMECLAFFITPTLKFKATNQGEM